MRERSDFSLAMIASVLLHGGLLAAVMLARPWDHPLPIGAAVPVNIVSNAQLTDLRAAIQAAKAQTAQTPEPVADAPPAAAEPEPQPAPKPVPPPPQPTPPPPKPVPAPTPKPVVPPKAPTKPEKAFDLDKLAATLRKDAGARPAPGQKGARQAETAPIAHPQAGAGQRDLANAMAGLSDELGKLWNPNCQVEGGRNVKVVATFTLGPSGQIVGAVDVAGLDQSPNPVVKAGAERAIRAVHRFAPFPVRYQAAFGQRMHLNFDAKDFCDKAGL